MKLNRIGCQVLKPTVFANANSSKLIEFPSMQIIKYFCQLFHFMQELLVLMLEGDSPSATPPDYVVQARDFQLPTYLCWPY